MRKSPFLNRVYEEMMRRRYAKRTIETYLHWIKRFILFHNKRHPETMGDAEVEAFLDYLVLQRNVASGTQALVLNTLCFLYKEIIGTPLSLELKFVKSKKPQKLPVVLTREEVAQLFSKINANYYLPAAIMYGSGLRLMEAIRLRACGCRMHFATNTGRPINHSTGSICFHLHGLAKTLKTGALGAIILMKRRCKKRFAWRRGKP